MTTDVNEQFASEKRGQIEMARALVEANTRNMADYDSGKTQAELDAKLAADVAASRVKMVGTDRYEVLEGWDRNEIFYVQRAVRPGEIPLILPETGLDYVGGQAQLYTAEPAWHSEGNLIAGGTSDIDTVLERGGIGHGVETRPVHYYAGGELRLDPDHFETTRDDTWAPLGVVGKLYTPFQNRDGASFLHELVCDHGVVFESAGPLRGGRRAFISMKLPQDVVIDEGGVGDIVKTYLCWMNSHDGSSPLQVIVTPWCPRCANTNRFAMRDAVTRWSVRHTKNGLERAEEARRTLGLGVKYYEEFGREENQLAHTKFDVDEFQELLEHLWPTSEDDPQRKQTITANRSEVMNELFEIETARLGPTAYAAEQAVTGYLDHRAPRKGAPDKMAAARATAILEGSSDDMKSRAHRRLLTRSMKLVAA